jgi:outer membrane protein assembly factor BamE (lipoprotein component of BamABCDE complex)
MRFRTAIIFIALAAAVAGCTTLRESYSSFKEGFAEWRETFWREAFEDPAKVDRIALGSTRQQVREMLGEPHQQSALNGEETWTYKSYRTLPKAYLPLTNAKSGSMQSLAVYIEFGRDGRVRKLDTEKQQW